MTVREVFVRYGSMYIRDVILSLTLTVGAGHGTVHTTLEQQVNVLGTTEATGNISLNFGLGVNFLTSAYKIRNNSVF